MVKGMAFVTSVLIVASILFSAETESYTEEDTKAEVKTDEEIYKERVPVGTKTLVKKLMTKGGYTLSNPLEQKETGILHIDADRYKSDIAIDGKTYKERTPYTFTSFPTGKHWIVVSDEDGYGAKEINLEPDDSLAVFISLCDKKDTVHISSSPAKAKVVIDGKEHGKTPLTTSLWVGSHQVEVMKNKYITQKLIVMVDSSGDNMVKVDLKGKATLSVVAKPDFAYVYINGSYAGKGKIDAYTVEAGDVEIRIEAPKYTLFKTTEKIELGKTKKIKKELECLFGSLEVTSKPDKVSLFLNDVEIGTTPYRQSSLRTGKYKLTLLEDNYNKITEDVVIQPNEVLKRNYSLKYTKAYKDSLRRERWIAHGAQGLRRALFCALGAACGAAGYYFEMKLRDNVENYSYWEDEYDNLEDTDDRRFKEIKENYYRERNQAKTNRSNRNLFIGVAGVCGAGLCISIFF